MQNPLSIALVAVALLPQTCPTFSCVLRPAKVAQVTAEVRERYVTKLKQTFVVTDEALRRLRREEVPESVLRQLAEETRGKEYEGEGKFFRALRNALGREQAKKFHDKIIENTRGFLTTDEEFITFVNRSILQTEVPEGVNAERWLREKHAVFLRNIISFVGEETAEPHRIRLTVPLLEKYRVQGGRCGEVPCPNCPCRNCKPNCR